VGRLFSHVLGFRSDCEEWRTPWELFRELAREFGPFELDPAATAENALAPAYFTVETDGLAQDWAPATVFLNPPYGRRISRWIAKAAHEAELGARVVALIPARTDTSYWHRYIHGRATLVRFLEGRVRFVRPGGRAAPAPFPSAVVVWGPRV